MLIDTERNTNAYWQMVGAIRSERPFGFGGAGVSAALGYPSWDWLIHLLAEEVQRICGDDLVDPYGHPLRFDDIRAVRSLLIRAEILKHNLGERYFEFMKETFGPVNRSADSVDDLVALPFKHLLTSNYDPSLERAIMDGGAAAYPICLLPQEIDDFIVHRNELTYSRRVIHVHGTYNRPETIVLTEADYARCYNTREIETFWNIIAVGEICVFFGFSFADDDITDGFNLKNFERLHRQFAPVRHYALVAIEDREKEVGERMVYNMRYGVEPVFFTKQDANFSGYGDALRQIRRDVLLRAAATVIDTGVTAARLAPEGVLAVTAPADANQGPAVQRDLAALDRITERNIQLQVDGDLE